MSNYDLTPGERERIALALSDALMPYGRDFNAEDAARLLEARLSVLLSEARAEAWERGHFYCAAEQGADARCVNPYEVR